jgi:hypothetical protein
MADIWFGDFMKKNKIKPYVIKHEKTFLTYNKKMVENKINTIFDDYVRTRNDKEQTKIVQNWVNL